MNEYKMFTLDEEITTNNCCLEDCVKEGSLFDTEDTLNSIVRFEWAYQFYAK